VTDLGEHRKFEARAVALVGKPTRDAHLESQCQHAVAKHTGGDAVVIGYHAIGTRRSGATSKRTDGQHHDQYAH